MLVIQKKKLRESSISEVRTKATTTDKQHQWSVTTVKTGLELYDPHLHSVT